MKLYRDKKEKFECEIELEGASIKETVARLLLHFDNGEIHLFEGSLSNDGQCKVDIPALTQSNCSKGKAILEIIADNTYFTPWESDFDIEQSKKVSVKEVNFGEAQTKKPTIKSAPKSKKIYEAKHPDLPLKSTCSDEAKYIVNELWDHYIQQKLAERTKIKILINEESIPDTIKSWASKVFKDINSLEAKVCMFYMSKSGKK